MLPPEFLAKIQDVDVAHGILSQLFPKIESGWYDSLDRGEGTRRGASQLGLGVAANPHRRVISTSEPFP